MTFNDQNRVEECQLPSSSLLHARMETGDFLDCFAVKANMPPRRAAEVITAFPGWARFLLRVRRLVTIPFGLAQSGPADADLVGPFPVERETPTELVAGFNDKHLDFRVSVMSTDGRVTLATWVRRHNLGGRFYLRLIMPFHVMIARNALSRVARECRAQSHK